MSTKLEQWKLTQKWTKLKMVSKIWDYIVHQVRQYFCCISRALSFIMCIWSVAKVYWTFLYWNTFKNLQSAFYLLRGLSIQFAWQYVPVTKYIRLLCILSRIRGLEMKIDWFRIHHRFFCNVVIDAFKKHIWIHLQVNIGYQYICLTFFP